MEGVTRAGLQNEQNGRGSLVATTDSKSRQQYRTTVCALKHTRSSYKPAIYLDSGLPFDASSEVHGGGFGPGCWRSRARRAWTHTRVHMQYL